METIRAVQTKDYIVSAIRNEILSGNMEPGEELTQEAIAEQLGVSRMPVREALQALAQEGLIVRLPNRHMQVAVMEEKQVKDTFCMAAAMETEIFSMIAKEKRQELAKWICSLTALMVTKEGNGAAEAELDWHKSVVAQLFNPYVQQLFTRLLDSYISYVILHLKYDRAAAAALLERAAALWCEGEELELKAVMEQYYGRMADMLLTHKEERYE